MYPFHENAGLFIVSKIIIGRSRLRYRLGTLTTYSDNYQVPPEVNFLMNSSKQVISVILYFYNCVPKWNKNNGYAAWPPTKLIDRSRSLSVILSASKSVRQFSILCRSLARYFCSFYFDLILKEHHSCSSRWDLIQLTVFRTFQVKNHSSATWTLSFKQKKFPKLRKQWSTDENIEERCLQCIELSPNVWGESNCNCIIIRHTDIARRNFVKFLSVDYSVNYWGIRNLLCWRFRIHS